MHAYLVEGKNIKNINSVIEKIVKSHGAKKYEVELSTIKEVRDLKSFLKTSFDSPFVIIAKSIENASVESMNSFLKTLEEEKENVIFVLTTSNKNLLLPTILSRCQLVMTSGKSEIDEKTLIKAEEFVTGDTGDRFLIADKIKGRNEALEFLGACEQVAKKHITNELEMKRVSTLVEEIISAKKDLKSNTNVTLTLTKLIVFSDALAK